MRGVAGESVIRSLCVLAGLVGWVGALVSGWADNNTNWSLIYSRPFEWGGLLTTSGHRNAAQGSAHSQSGNSDKRIPSPLVSPQHFTFPLST